MSMCYNVDTLMTHFSFRHAKDSDGIYIYIYLSEASDIFL